MASTPTTAVLLAETAVTVIQVALEEWLDRDDDRTLFEVMLETIGSLQATLTTFPPFPTGAAARQLPDKEIPDRQLSSREFPGPAGEV